LCRRFEGSVLEIHLRDTGSDADGAGIEVATHQFEIAESRRHEDVGPATPGYEIASDLLAVPRVMSSLSDAQHVLTAVDSCCTSRASMSTTCSSK
jgi:hypothetical protein